MKYLRNVDHLSYSLASSQARIFERSVALGIPSKTFVRSFLLSNEAKRIDDLNLDIAGLTEGEILDTISKRIKTRRGEIYPFAVMHFMGYFYRMASYLTGHHSKDLYRQIKPEFLFKNYQTLHALSIEEAIKETFEMMHIEEKDKYALFKKIYMLEL